MVVVVVMVAAAAVVMAVAAVVVILLRGLTTNITSPFSDRSKETGFTEIAGLSFSVVANLQHYFLLLLKLD